MIKKIQKPSIRRKFAYIKNGDVIEEIMAIGEPVPDVILQNGGPHHYIGSFLKWAGTAQVLLMSLDINDKRFKGQNGLIAEVMNTKQFHGRLSQTYLHLKAFVRIFLGLVRFKPHWILCAIGGGLPMAACYLASKILHVPYVHTRHMRIDLYHPSALQELKQRVDAWMIRKASYVLCNGPYLNDQLVKAGVQKEKIIEFGTPYRSITTGNRHQSHVTHQDSAPQKCDVFYVGRIEENKGAKDLLDACRPLLLENDDVRLTFIGNGKLLNALESSAIQWGLTGKALFLGHLPHHEAMQKMQSCDILIIPTRQELGEGRCKSGIEGLIMGCCLLVPDYGAFRYLVVNNVNGLMYLPDNIEDMRQKIHYLIHHPEVRRRLGDTAGRMSEELAHPRKKFWKALDEAETCI